MKILWITNIPVGRSFELMGRAQKYTSGAWLESALAEFMEDDSCSVTLATVTPTKGIQTLSDGRINYCLLPGGFPERYDLSDPKNIKNWQYVQEIFRPDIIHVWGTEFKHGYLAMKAMRDLPSVIYMQGVLGLISRHYLAGMTNAELRRSITLRDIIKRDWITRKQGTIAKDADIESEMLRLSRHVIVENKWCASYCRSIHAELEIHQCNLSIKEVFFRRHWRAEAAKPYAIFCNAGGYPAKGLHVLLRALKIVASRFPEVELWIPGEGDPFAQGLLGSLKERGYARFIKRLILELGLKHHIKYLGPLDSDQMAEMMASAHAFAMPSCIENHSSTLIEAMIVGMPCVAAYVGGIPEYMSDHENGLLYRFEDHERLADHLCTLFSNPPMASALGEAASRTMRANRLAQNHKDRLMGIYREILERTPNH